MASAFPYQHEVLIPLQMLQALGQPQSLLLPGLLLQTSELLTPLLFPGGFVLYLAQGDYCGEAKTQRAQVWSSIEAARHIENKTGMTG